MTCGPGTMPWMVIAPTISAITALGGMPRVSSGMKAVCAPALLADSGPETPSIAPFSETAGVFGDLLLDGVGGEGTKHRAIARQDAQKDRRSRCRGQNRLGRLPEIRFGRQQRANPMALRHRGSRHSPGCAGFRRSRKCPWREPRSRGRPTGVAQPKVMRSAPVSRSCPIVERARPHRIMAIALATEPRASTTAKTRPMIISEKYSAGPNSSASLVSGWPMAAMNSVATGAGNEGADGGNAQRRARAALPGHLVAVERGDDSRSPRREC